MALATVYFVWGSTYLAIRVMVETIPPLLGAGVRFLLPGLTLLAILAWRSGRDRVKRAARELLAAAVVGALLLLGGNGLVTVAEQEAPSGLAALIIAAVPLFVILFRLATRERVPAATLAGVALGFFGVALLVLPSDRPDDAALWSVLTLVAAAAAWAAGSFLSPRLPLPGDVFVSTAYSMVLGGAALLLVGCLAGELADLDADAVSVRSWVSLAYLIVAGSLLAFTAYVWLLQNAPISTVATYAFVNPVIAVVLGWAVLAEELTPAMLLGAGAIVVSVAFVVRREGRRAAP